MAKAQATGAKLIPYDSKRHTRNASGRWVDIKGKRLVSLDPATIPQTVEHPAAATLQGIELPPATPQSAQPAAAPHQAAPAQTAQPAPASVAPAQAAPAQQGGASSAPSGFNFAALDDVGEGGQPPDATGLDGSGGMLPHEQHIPGCYKGHAEGRMCGCGVRVFDPMPKDEAEAMAGMAITTINRFSPYPSEPSAAEMSAWTSALDMLSVRYGNPLAAWSPYIALFAAVVPTVVMRRIDLQGMTQAGASDGAAAAPSPQSAPQSAPVRSSSSMPQPGAPELPTVAR